MCFFSFRFYLAYAVIIDWSQVLHSHIHKFLCADPKHIGSISSNGRTQKRAHAHKSIIIDKLMSAHIFNKNETYLIEPIWAPNKPKKKKQRTTSWLMSVAWWISVKCLCIPFTWIWCSRFFFLCDLCDRHFIRCRRYRMHWPQIPHRKCHRYWRIYNKSTNSTPHVKMC